MRRSGDWCVRSWLLLPEMHRLLNILQGMKDQYLFPVGQPSDCCVQMIAPSRRLFCLAPARCGQRQVDHTGIVSGAGFPDKPSRLQRPHGLADRGGRERGILSESGKRDLTVRPTEQEGENPSLCRADPLTSALVRGTAHEGERP